MNWLSVEYQETRRLRRTARCCKRFARNLEERSELHRKHHREREAAGTFNGNLGAEGKAKKINKRSYSNINSRESKNVERCQTFYEKSDKTEKSEKQSAVMKRNETSFKENMSDLNLEQENKRGGFNGIFPKDYRVEVRDKQDKIVREQVNKFDPHSDLKKLKKIDEFKNKASKLRL